MLRTHEYEFLPGKRTFRKDSIVSTEGTVALSKRVIISAPCGSGWLVVRERGTGDKSSETGPGEFKIPYSKGTYTIDLPFRWPVATAFEVTNIPDGVGGVVRVSLVRSQEPDGIIADRLLITSDGEPLQVGNVGSAATFPTARVIIKCSSESDEPFAYSHNSGPAFNACPKLYPGEALPEIEVRRAFTLYCITAGVAGALTYAEWIAVPT